MKIEFGLTFRSGNRAPTYNKDSLIAFFARQWYTVKEAYKIPLKKCENIV
jgi:hypothetical protein